jgi:hypothetical protein
MTRWFQPGRLGPIVAGLAGICWFVAELAPQGYGFADTDDPRVSLAFVAAHPTDWALAGVLLIVASVALIVAVIATGDRLATGTATDRTAGSDVPLRAVTVVGLLSASFLFGHGVVRMGGGPLLYVKGLDAGWGEAAYLVTQFVGVHLLAQGGILLLTTWIVAVAWLGVRRRVVPMPLFLLALLPGVRLLGFLGPWSVLPEELWILFMAGIPAAFLWLVLLGVSSADTLARRTAHSARLPEVSEATAT